MGVCKLEPYSLHFWIGILQVCRNISMIEEWNDKYDDNKEYWEDDFMD